MPPIMGPTSLMQTYQHSCCEYEVVGCLSKHGFHNPHVSQQKMCDVCMGIEHVTLGTRWAHLHYNNVRCLNGDWRCHGWSPDHDNTHATHSHQYNPHTTHPHTDTTHTTHQENTHTTHPHKYNTRTTHPHTHNTPTHTRNPRVVLLINYQHSENSVYVIKCV